MDTYASIITLYLISVCFETVLGVLNYTDIKTRIFNTTDCGEDSLIIPGESCINIFHLEGKINYFDFRLVVIDNKAKQQHIYQQMKNWGVTEAVIGLRRIADSQLWWGNGQWQTYSARNRDRKNGFRTCFTINTQYPVESSWLEKECNDLPNYYLYEWTKYFIDRERITSYLPFYYNESKPYLFQCHNNESISFVFECDQKVDCSDGSDELNCEYSNAECLLTEKGKEYYGTHRTMDLGIPCQRWEKQYYHSHRYTHLSKEENFCRDADSALPACYSKSYYIRWGHCDIPMCNQSQKICLNTESGIEFNGPINITKSGKFCQRWDIDIPHKHTNHRLDNQDNFCRNIGDKERPWCYTTDPATRWEYCDIPKCGVMQCPEGFIQCLSGVCIPLHKSCDGIPDCPNEEDEVDCGEFSCPAMFKCRGTPRCIPLYRTCDDFEDCPNGDDEILCNFHCPQECNCRGLSFKCSSFNNTVAANISKYARTIDLSSVKFDISGMYFGPFLNLATLNLSDCGILDVKPNYTYSLFQELRNMLVLDLSGNFLTVIKSYSFQGLSHLKNLYLDGNSNLQTIQSYAFHSLHKVLSLRIANSKLKNLEENSFNGMSSLRVLDLRNNQLQYLKKGVFNELKSLSHLYITGNKLRIGKDMFHGLVRLEWLGPDSYDICCMTPATVTGKSIICTARKFQVSSCDNLISYEVLRLSIWVVSGLALLGNLGSLVYRILYDRERIKRTYSVFIIGLSISDLLMGVYMLIIASFDVKFRGQYIWNDLEWRESQLCAFAGILATLSSESSAMLICLLALDRCLSIKLPFSRKKFNFKSSVTISFVCFAVALLLAVIPLFPLPYFDGKFYSRSSVCVALPLTSDRPDGWEYSVAVFVLLNMVLFLTVGITQIIIYIDVKRTMSSARNSQQSVEISVARTLAAVVMTDFFCWFPVGAMGIMSLLSVEIPSDVYAWVIVFVLPINSALNPLLYTFTKMRKNRASTRRSSHHPVTETENFKSSVIPLQLHQSIVNKFETSDVSIESYLQQSGYEWKHVYAVCWFIIRELNLLHSNNVSHGSLTEKDIRVIIKHSGIVDIFFQFTEKTETDLTSDVYNYGEIVKRLIRAKVKNDKGKCVNVHGNDE